MKNELFTDAQCNETMNNLKLCMSEIHKEYCGYLLSPVSEEKEKELKEKLTKLLETTRMIISKHQNDIAYNYIERYINSIDQVNIINNYVNYDSLCKLYIMYHNAKNTNYWQQQQKQGEKNNG